MAYKQKATLVSECSFPGEIFMYHVVSLQVYRNFSRRVFIFLYQYQRG